MFKKLKDKIEEVKQSPLKITQIAQAVVSPTSSSVIEPVSNANFSIGDDCEDTPQSSPAKEGFQAVDLRDVPSPLPSGRRSRQSSVSSITSDASSLFPIYEMPAHSFNLQSDLESASEIDEGTSQLAQVPKQELYRAYLNLQRRYQKYKGRSNDLLNYCRELDKDNRKLKNVLLECQEKSLRRISELKEQCALEQRAKAHLEEALRNDLEEKDHLIQTLQTKVKLLKESSTSGGNSGCENILIDFSEESNSSPVDVIEAHSDHLLQLNASKEATSSLLGEESTSRNNEETPNALLADKASLDKLCEADVGKAKFARLEELTKEMERLKEENAQYLKMCNDLKLSLKNLEDSSKLKIDDLNERLCLSEVTRKNLSKGNDELSNNQRQLADQVQKLTQKLETKEDEINVSIEERCIVQQKFEELEKSSKYIIDDLKEKLSVFGRGANITMQTNAEIPSLSSDHSIKSEELISILQAENKGLKSSLQQLEVDFKNQANEFEGKLSLCEEGKKKSMLCNNELKEIQVQLTAHIEDMTNQIKVLKEENEIYVKENNDLKLALRSLEDSISGKVFEFEKKISVSEKEREKYAQSNSELQNIKTQLNSKIEGLTTELQRLKKDNDYYTEENNHLNLSLQKVNDEMNGIQEKLLVSEEEKKKIVTSNQELSSIKTQLNNQINDLSSKVEELKKDNAVYIKENSDLIDSLKKLEDNFTEEISKLNTDLLTCKEEKEGIILSNNELKSIQCEHDAQIEHYITENTYLMASLKKLEDNFKDQIDSVKKLEDNFKEQINKLVEKLSLLEDEKEKAVLSNSMLSNVHCDLNAQIENLTVKIKMLEEEKVGYLEENSNLKASFQSVESSWKDKVHELEMKFLASEGEKDKALTSCNELSTIKCQLCDQVEELTCILQKIKEGNAIYVKENSDLKSLVKQLEDSGQEQVDVVKKKLIKCEGEMEKANLLKIELLSSENVLKTQIVDLMDQLQTVREDLALRVKENDDLKLSLKRNDDAMHRNFELEEKLRLCEEEKEKLLEFNNELSTTRNQLGTHIEDLSSELEDLKKKNTTIIGENNDLKSSMKEMEKVVSDRVLNVKQMMDLCDKEKEKLTLSNNELNRIQSQLTTEIEDLSCKLKMVNEENILLTKEHSELQNAAAEAKKRIEDLEAEVTLLAQEREKLKSSNSEISVAQKQLETQLNAEMSENKLLVKQNGELNIVVHTLNADFEVMKLENKTLLSNMEELKYSAQHADKSKCSQLDEMHEKLNTVSEENSQLLSKIQDLNTCNNKLTNELESLQSKNNELFDRIIAFSEDKTNLECKFSAERDKFNENITHLSADVTSLKEENELLTSELHNLRNQSSANNFQEEFKKICDEKKILQQQLFHHKKLVNSTTQKCDADSKSLKRKIQQLVVDKIVLKQELNKLLLTIEEKEKIIADRDEEHIQKIKQLAVDLGKQLAEKDEELQNVHTKNFVEHVENEERHIIQQLRSQIRDIMEDYQKGNDAYELLMEDHKAAEKARDAEKSLLEQQIRDLQQRQENEINELNKKWRSYLNKELDIVHEKHKTEVAELSREWHWERRNCVASDNEIASEELENTSQLAVAAVESGTGSIELLHKQVVALTQELKEVKRKHKCEIEETNKLLLLRQKSSDGPLCTFHENCIEMEYIRNIMFQYMMGKEQVLLAKVIAAVMKFDPDQTNQVLQKEVHKQTLLGHLGIL